MQYTERIKLALTYAEESSKRARWIVFILQLAVIVVLASLWQQADSNWLQQRLYAAQDLVRVLSCQPDKVYGETVVNEAKKSMDRGPSLTLTGGAEYFDSKYSCAAVMKDDARIKRAYKYQKDWGFSLTEAKKNVSDLQQLMVNRVLGVSFPVLGVVFDVNDLSLLAGVTFVILLSWFHFALRRQNKNITHVFDIARKADLSGSEPDNCLSETYYLLAMTQVLTIPPAEEKDTQKPTFLMKMGRLSSLIMWTSVVAQALVLIDDGLTMARGNTLSPTVNYIESGLAALLWFYLIVRTNECYKIMATNQTVWNEAFRDAHISPADRRGAAEKAK